MNPYISLAKKAVETYIKEGKIIDVPRDLPKELLKKKAGTFVTIEKRGESDQRQLRGCIGTYLPTKENIAQEIIANAIAASTEDYRFGPIHKEELPSLSCTVYILSKPELVYPVRSPEQNSGSRPWRLTSNGVKDLKELDPKKYGIIVKTLPIASPDRTDVVFNGHLPHKSGLLLPDLEGIDTIEKQIGFACQKGGIDPSRDQIFIYRFTVEKYTDED